MNSDSLIVQQPAGTARHLVLLMHGVGSVPQSMLEAARWFAKLDRQACVVSVASPEPADIAPGRQWFSVRGVTEDNRQARVDAAMPVFVSTVQRWQLAAGVDAAHTLLVGFSQGAIMALESTKLPASAAARVVAMAGRSRAGPGPPDARHHRHGARQGGLLLRQAPWRMGVPRLLDREPAGACPCGRRRAGFAAHPNPALALRPVAVHRVFTGDPSAASCDAARVAPSPSVSSTPPQDHHA